MSGWPASDPSASGSCGWRPEVTGDGGRRATITGIGLFTPVGRKTVEFFDALCVGRSGLRRPAEGTLDAEVAAFAPDLDPAEVLPATETRSVDRFVTMALAAAGDALADAAVRIGTDVDPQRVAIVLSSAGGGMTTYEQQVVQRQHRGRFGVSPFLLPGMMQNMAAARMAIRFGVHGATSTLAAACAGGGQAVGEALRLIRAGEADIVLCGGTEAPLTPTTVSGFANCGALATGWVEPEQASRPFDKLRNGIVLGEGAAVLVLERTGHADGRAAPGYADVLGWGASTDAHHPIMPRPDGRQAAECMRRALRDAGIDPSEVDYLNAHATSTRRGDIAEVRAISEVFGDGPPPVSSTKAVTGHLLGAAGAVEAAASALAVATGVVPPTHNLSEPDPACGLDHVLTPREQPVRVVMSNSFGFGGQNVTLIAGQPGTRGTR